jgi:hypothetical protein
MATKKKAAKPRAADKCPQEVVITGTGPNEMYTYVDASGKKHHPKVFWQALDLTKQYQIVLAAPPAPFTNGNVPFPTDPITGRTDTLTVDSSLPAGSTVYSYTVQILVRSRWKRLAGGGIIIDG